jgi:hypothetical protein
MADTQLKRHPFRAAFWGFILGLGVAVYLTFVWSVIGLDTITGVVVKWILVVGGVMILSILWGLFGPAKKPKGPAPAFVDTAPPAPAFVDTAPPAPAFVDTAPPAVLEEAPAAPEEAPPPASEG